MPFNNIPLLGKLLLFVASLLVAFPLPAAGQASKPLFRDPLYDGAADPVLVRERATGDWLMFYTARRANVAGLSGVAWVHGTPIGRARSKDAGGTWQADGLARIALPAEYAEPTLWAPEIIDDGSLYHMFLTVVPGIFEDWKHPRHIVHLTSPDLSIWTYIGKLELGSDRVIDACILRMPNGIWRLWYNNERDGKSIYWAESSDLKTWQLKGKAVGDRSGEGPKVFQWRGSYWMITDVWRGLGVYRSDDAQTWVRQQANILDKPGLGADDGVKGGHADIVVSGQRAFVFYFTHPGRTPDNEKKDGFEQRRSSIQVAELELRENTLHCDRDRSLSVCLPSH